MYLRTVYQLFTIWVRLTRLLFLFYNFLSNVYFTYIDYYYTIEKVAAGF